MCMCGRNELEVYSMLAYPHINSFRTVPVLQPIHKHMHTCILMPFEDSEPEVVKVDISALVTCI